MLPSAMMTRIFGFCDCCARADDIEVVAIANAINPGQIFLANPIPCSPELFGCTELNSDLSLVFRRQRSLGELTQIERTVAMSVGFRSWARYAISAEMKSHQTDCKGFVVATKTSIAFARNSRPLKSAASV